MLKTVWTHIKKGWMKFAEVLGWVNTRLLLGLTYIIILGPISLIMLILRKDPLRKRMNKRATTYWISKAPADNSLEAAKHQF